LGRELGIFGDGRTKSLKLVSCLNACVILYTSWLSVRYTCLLIHGNFDRENRVLEMTEWRKIISYLKGKNESVIPPPKKLDLYRYS